jgi:hypothetical protein
VACTIVYLEQHIALNNLQFDRLNEMAIEVGRGSGKDSREAAFVERMVRMRGETFWPGRGIDIAKDFPLVEEQEFWSRVLLDTARAIFDRRVGEHENAFWQAQTIWQAYGTGMLFQDAVRRTEPRWSADSLDRREFDHATARPDRGGG